MKVLTGEAVFDLHRTIDEVYSAISNVAQIGDCVAGVKEVKVLSETESEWKVEARVGVIAQTINLRGRITERRPPAYLAFAAEGQHISLSGSLTLAATDLGHTQCRVAVVGEVTGALAPIINLIARTAQQQLIDETVANLRRKLERLDPQG